MSEVVIGEAPQCGKCGRDRTEADWRNYSPAQVILGHPIGWYSADDGELCPECMTAMIANQ